VFKIKLRITNGIDELKTMTSGYFDKEWSNIEGFIEVEIGEHKEGCYYHENPLQPGEVGAELINWWLELFLKCANHIKKAKYVAFHEPDTANRWLEFKLIDDMIVINVALDTKQVKKDFFISEVCDDFTYIEPTGFKISLNDFFSEIDDAAKVFFDKLGDINLELLKTKMVIELLNLTQTRQG